MLKCPFCHFDNEDGALFCEQCKSDLASAVPVAQAEPLPLEAIPTASPVVMEAIAEPLPAAPYEAIPVAAAEAIPFQFQNEPLMAEPIQAIPIAPEPAPAHPAPPVAETHPYHPPSAPAPTPAAAPSASAPTPAAAAPALPAGAQPRLLVLRGQKRNVEYPIYEGLNFIGRADEKPVDIDLEDQEPPDRIWCSRQHACLSFENNELALEDLNSANGTYVNRTRIYPGQKRALVPNDIIQIGNVQLKVVV
jgi:FHA domain